MIAVGSYTESYGSFRAKGDGISTLHLSGKGSFRRTGSMFLPNPSYLRHSAQHQRTIATIETPDDRAALVALQLTSRGPRLQACAHVPVAGHLPCHIDFHPSGRWVAGACYGTGEVFVQGLSGRGEFDEEARSVIHRSGRGPHPLRQDRSHPHGANFSPDGLWLLVPDLGTDELAAYPFNPANGKTGTPRVWRAPPGSGPRTVAFSKCGRRMLLVSELSSEVSLLKWDEGKICEFDRRSAREPSIPTTNSENTSAGLKMHPDGLHAGVTNRGDDSISIFRLDAGNGTLQQALTFPSGGKKPRDLGFSPCGRWLVAANQDSDNCVLFEISLTARPVVQRMDEVTIRSPSNICFVTDEQH